MTEDTRERCRPGPEPIAHRAPRCKRAAGPPEKKACELGGSAATRSGSAVSATLATYELLIHEQASRWKRSHIHTCTCTYTHTHATRYGRLHLHAHTNTALRIDALFPGLRLGRYHVCLERAYCDEEI